MENGFTREYAYLDLGFYAGCNLKCTYCRPGLFTEKSPIRLEELKRKIEPLIREFKFWVLKMSGYGEITIWPDFEEGLKEFSDKFPIVQIISNGTFNDRVANAILSYSNVLPNITLDGVTIASNSLRTQGNSLLHTKILKNIERFTSSGKDIEVNCVLHEKNLPDFEKFCEYLSKLWPGRVMLFPFPVKLFDRIAADGQEVMQTNYSTFISQLDDLFEKYSGILPPKAYIDDLKKFLSDSQRTAKCSVHWANVGIGSQGTLLHCANYGEALEYGEIGESVANYETTVKNVEMKNLVEWKVGDWCKKCFNHYDILNTFLEGRCSIDEIMTVPSLSRNSVRDILLSLKNRYEILIPHS